MFVCFFSVFQGWPIARNRRCWCRQVWQRWWSSTTITAGSLASPSETWSSLRASDSIRCAWSGTAAPGDESPCHIAPSRAPPNPANSTTTSRDCSPSRTIKLSECVHYYFVIICFKKKKPLEPLESCEKKLNVHCRCYCCCPYPFKPLILSGGFALSATWLPHRTASSICRQFLSYYYTLLLLLLYKTDNWCWTHSAEFNIIGKLCNSFFLWKKKRI